MIVEVNSKNKINDFNKSVKGGNIIVLYYADWCGYCQMMKPDWDDFKKQSKAKYPHLRIAEVESTHIPQTDFANEVGSYPTIKFYKKNTNNLPVPESINYEGERKAKDLLNFAINNDTTSTDKNNMVPDFTNNSLEEETLTTLLKNNTTTNNTKGKKTKKSGSKKKGAKRSRTIKLTANSVNNNETSTQPQKKKGKKTKKTATAAANNKAMNDLRDFMNNYINESRKSMKNASKTKKRGGKKSAKK